MLKNNLGLSVVGSGPIWSFFACNMNIRRSLTVGQAKYVLVTHAVIGPFEAT